MKTYQKAQYIYSYLLKDENLRNVDRQKLYLEYLCNIRKAAYLGHGEAQFDLALHYEEYNFFGKNEFFNPKKVFYWSKKACENNVSAACNNLGTYYESGTGCNKNLTMAIQYYNLAVNLGSKEAIENLTILKKSK